MLLAAAHRAGVAAADPAIVACALNAAAEQLSCDVTRMPMMRYDALCSQDPALPTVAVVLATFSTWKGARVAAARVRQPQPDASASMAG